MKSVIDLVLDRKVVREGSRTARFQGATVLAGPGTTLPGDQAHGLDVSGVHQLSGPPTHRHTVPPKP